MSGEYFTFGVRIRQRGLRDPRAIAFVRALRKHPYARYRRAVSRDGFEGIEFDIQPELPQRPCFDIQDTERVCVVFGEQLHGAPGVYAMRRDFSTEVPDLNVTKPDEPRSLCLFADDYREIESALTNEILLDRIASWLARAAVDQLRLPGQALEPLLISYDRVIFDRAIFERLPEREFVAVWEITKKPHHVYYCASRSFDAEDLPEGPCFMAVPMVAQPSDGRSIHYMPTNLDDLHQLLANVGLDIVAELQERTRALCAEASRASLLRYAWLLIVRLPKQLPHTGALESEHWAFFVHEEIGKLGANLGVFEKYDNDFLPLVLRPRYIVGYNLFNFIRASAVVNRQSMPDFFAFRSRSHFAIAVAN